MSGSKNKNLGTSRVLSLNFAIVFNLILRKRKKKQLFLRTILRNMILNRDLEACLYF